MVGFHRELYKIMREIIEINPNKDVNQIPTNHVITSIIQYLSQ